MDPDTQTCAAFPAGIPDEILRQGFDHRNEYPGDNGVRFTPSGPVDPAKLDAMVRSTERVPGEVKTGEAGSSPVQQVGVAPVHEGSNPSTSRSY
jgi:hypothetical protein